MSRIDLFYFGSNSGKQKQDLHQRSDVIAPSLSLAWKRQATDCVTESLCSRSEEGVIREKEVCQLLPEVSPIFSSRLAKSLVGNYGLLQPSSEKKRFESALLKLMETGTVLQKFRVFAGYVLSKGQGPWACESETCS